MSNSASPAAAAPSSHYRGHIFEEGPGDDASHWQACRGVIALAESNAGLAAVRAQHYTGVLLTRQLADQAASARILADVYDGARLALLPAADPEDRAWETSPKPGSRVKLSGSWQGTIGALSADWFVLGSYAIAGSLAFIPASADTVRTEAGEPPFGLSGADTGDVYVDGYPLDHVAHDDSPGAAHRELLTRLLLHAAFDYGVTRAVLIAGLEYLVSRSRAWREAPSSRASEDPLVLERVGGYIARAHGFELLLGELAVSADEAPPDTAVLQSTVRRADQARHYGCAFAAEMSSGLIELLGASSSERRFHFDRYWRDLRAHCLLDRLPSSHALDR